MEVRETPLPRPLPGAGTTFFLHATLFPEQPPSHFVRAEAKSAGSATALENRACRDTAPLPPVPRKR